MNVSIQIVPRGVKVGILRLHDPDGSWAKGDDYIDAATVLITGSEAEICGLVLPSELVSPDTWRAIEEVLARLGVTDVDRVRQRNGEPHHFRYHLHTTQETKMPHPHTEQDFENAVLPAIKAFVTANDTMIHEVLAEQRRLGVTEAQMAPWTHAFATRDAFLKKHGIR